MLLTKILFRAGGPRKYPKGSIWHGKYRIVKPVTSLDKAKKIEEFKVEERNMFLLRHPYLSVQEECGYLKEQNKHEKWINEKKIAQLKKFEERTVLTDHLCDLRSNENWD